MFFLRVLDLVGARRIYVTLHAVCFQRRSNGRREAEAVSKVDREKQIGVRSELSKEGIACSTCLIFLFIISFLLSLLIIYSSLVGAIGGCMLLLKDRF